MLQLFTVSRLPASSIAIRTARGPTLEPETAHHGPPSTTPERGWLQRRSSAARAARSRSGSRVEPGVESETLP